MPVWTWLRKLLGYHVCEEFTRWTTRQADFERPVGSMAEKVIPNVTHVRYTRRWQERECTICGRVEQRDIR
jgi:hypothetical protein